MILKVFLASSLMYKDADCCFIPLVCRGHQCMMVIL